jgi:glycosyltransferase involved in cell wall biosynthesis
MRICLINLGALPALSQEHKRHRIGGEEVQHAQLAAALTRLGHDVSLVVADLGQPDGAIYEGVRTLKAYKESAGIPMIRFVYPRWVKLWSAIARANADVYYCSCAGMLVGLLAMYCRHHRKRLVFRTAIDSDCEPENLLIRYQRDRWLYEYGLRRADVVLVQTVTQQRALKKNYGLDGVIADMLVAMPMSGEASMSKDIDVLWTSNLRHIKRPDRLIELARAMPDYRFHMAGGPSPGEEDLFRRIEIEARSLPNLTFHGAVPYLDIGALFARARLFANTSDLEGFPNTFLQSWLRGIPVVTMFDPDSVVQREGLGSAHSTVADMVAGLGRLLQSRKAYSAASAATREFMRDRFGDDRVLAPYLLAFDESEVRMTGGLPAVNAPITGVDTAADGRRR